DARTAFDGVERLADPRARDALLRVPLIDLHGSLDLDQLSIAGLAKRAIDRELLADLHVVIAADAEVDLVVVGEDQLVLDRSVEDAPVVRLVVDVSLVAEEHGVRRNLPAAIDEAAAVRGRRRNVRRIGERSATAADL